MAITPPVQFNQADVASGAGPFTLAFAAPTTAGNLIAVAVRIGGTGTASITDDKSGGSNTYNTDVSLAHVGLGTGYLFTAPNAGAAQTITITLSASTTVRWIILEYSGLASSPLDKTSSLYTATGGTTANSGSTGTTTQASELLIGVLITNGTGDTAIAGTSQSYVIEDRVPASPNNRVCVEDVVVNATGAYLADFTGLNNATDHIALIGTYKAATAPSPTVPYNNYMVPILTQ